MSYSRWGNSVWYTYWDASSGDTKDTQVFTICGIPLSYSFDYRELVEDMEGCIKHVMSEERPRSGRIVGEELDFPPRTYNEDEWEELRGYMQCFIQDVEEDYPEND